MYILKIVLLAYTTQCIQSARILGVFQMPSISHQATFRPIYKELSLRGHEVIVVTPQPLNDPSLTNLTEIPTGYTSEILNRYGFEFFMSKEVSVHKKIQKIFEVNYELSEYVFNNERFKAIYNNPSEKFDLILVQTYISPILYALGTKLNAPVIGISSMGAWIGSHYAVGNPSPPSLYSEMFLPYNGQLTFYERIKSTLYFLWSRYYVNFVALPKCDEIVKKYLGDDLPYIGDIESNISALFLNTDPIFYPPRPEIPTVIPLGFIHITPPKALPADLKKEIESAKNGLIYFSLGSNVKSAHVPLALRKIFMDALAELPYKFLWKFEDDDMPGKPANVIIRKWLPQQDILAHPNVKAFVSQGGLQSTEEAIDRGVPMVVIPFISDQEMISNELRKYGVALSIEYLNVTKEEMKQKIVEVAENKIYRENMVKLKQLLKDEPMTGMERAIWWSEYIIRHKGTKHLRSPTADIPLYQYLLLDVFTVILLVTIIALFLVYKVLSFVLGRHQNITKVKTL